MVDKNHFNRYEMPEGPEAETQPGSRDRVLRNRRGIISPREIGLAEFGLLLLAQEHYATKVLTSETRITCELIRSMHRDWLGDLYTWAGMYRTVNVAKSGFAWPPAYRVPDLMASLESGILAELTPCRPGPVERVAHQIAMVHGELLMIHPFRDGNGRIMRWIADVMALQAGLAPPAYRFTGKGSMKRREAYLTGVRMAYAGECGPLTEFFSNALIKARTEAEG